MQVVPLGKMVYNTGESWGKKQLTNGGTTLRTNGLQLTLISILVLAVAVLAAAGLSMITPETVAFADGEGSQEVVAAGRLPGYEDYPVNTDPQSFYYLIGSNIVLNRPGAQGSLMIENTTGNTCQMKVTLALQDTGEVIYTSPILSPDQHIEKDYLDVELEEGTYDVVATILALDPDSGETMGTFSEQITVEIKNKLF